MTIKTLLPLLLCLSACHASPEKIDETAPVAQRQGQLQAATNTIKRLDIDQFIGDIRITPGDTAQVLVNYRIELHSASAAQAQLLLSQIKPVILARGDHLQLHIDLSEAIPAELLMPRASFKLGYFIGSGSTRTIRYQQREFQLKSRPAHNSPAFFVHLDLQVPTGLPLKIQQALGDLYAGQLRNPLELTSPAGLVRLEKLQQAKTQIKAAKQLSISGHQGDLSLTNTGREVLLADIQGQIAAQHQGELFSLSRLQGALQLNSRGGDIRLQQITGPVTLQSTDARVQLQQLQGPLRYKSHNGSLQLSQATGDLDLSSYNGPMALAEEIQSQHLRIFTDQGIIRLQQWPLQAKSIEIRNRAGLLQLPVPLPASCKPAQSSQRQSCYVDSPLISTHPANSTN
jgi:hypothetical protein